MMKAILIAMFVAAIAFCANEGIFAAGQTEVPEALVKELRPTLEFNEEQVKEPFTEVFSKIKEAPVDVPVKKADVPVQPPLPGMTIQGVIWGSSVPCVIINNRVLREGDSIDEVKVTKIEKEGVKLSYRGWNYNLPSPAGAATFINPEGGKQ
jgi:hypothetical protein